MLHYILMHIALHCCSNLHHVSPTSHPPNPTLLLPVLLQGVAMHASWVNSLLCFSSTLEADTSSADSSTRDAVDDLMMMAVNAAVTIEANLQACGTPAPAFWNPITNVWLANVLHKLATSVEQREGARERLQGTLLRDGVLLKWLGVLGAMALDAACRAVLDLAAYLLPPCCRDTADFCSLHRSTGSAASNRQSLDYVQGLANQVSWACGSNLCVPGNTIISDTILRCLAVQVLD